MSYQNMLQKDLRKEQLIDRKIELLTIINNLTTDPRNIVQKEQVIIEAHRNGFSEEETDELIEKLKEDNIIYESTPGFIKKR